MEGQFSRTERILGTESTRILGASHVAVFGIGGVGGYAAEALARSGIGRIDLIDSDTVELSNLNRQIIAAHSTIGMYKTHAMKERILDICPQADIRTVECFYLPGTKQLFDFSEYDYVVDAVDTVAAKIQLAVQAQESGTNIISCMGTGNKLSPQLLEVADIFETSVCPLARIMRHECKKHGIEKLKVVYSKEQPLAPLGKQPEENGRRPPGSTPFVPPAAGLIIAGEVVKDILGIQNA